ncbi:MAG: trypsin-like serine protease [Ruminococcaceae bacterium]|nr:trypsin-like serine protease [Oscillospiraceae bacterium]
MDKEFERPTSDESVNNDISENIIENEVKAEETLPYEQPELKTPTPINESDFVRPTPIPEHKVESTEEKKDATVSVSRPAPVSPVVQNNYNTYNPDNANGGGGIRTTYVPDPSRMSANPQSYSAYQVNNPAKPTYSYQTPLTPANNVQREEKKSKKKNTGFSAGKAVLMIGVSVILSLALSIGGTVLLLKNAEVNGDGEVEVAGITIITNKTASKDNTADRTKDKNGEKEEDVKKDNPPLNTTLSGTIVEQPEGSVAGAVQIAADSVVEISTEVVTTSFFYGEYVQSGAGSGVIIDAENGYIITCAHVIDGASAVTVKLRDGTPYEAEIIGSDAQTDIAVIKIEAEGLKAATLADSDDIVVGQTAIAIGNPLGTLGGTVSSGIVSALDREITIDGQKYSLLQIDTSINPGNSGGGLFNAAGELIGVVNAKSGGAESGTTIEGLGFAIPMNDAKAVADDLVERGFVKRPMLGISIVEYDGSQSVDRALYDYIYVGGYGVYFLEYMGEQEGDLKFGDKIVAVDDTEVSTKGEISSILSEHKAGETINVTVSRLNKETGRRQMKTVEVTLTEAEE